jgi:hypothetical protein
VSFPFNPIPNQSGLRFHTLIFTDNDSFKKRGFLKPEHSRIE